MLHSTDRAMKQPYPQRTIHIREALAKRWIWILSSIVFIAVVVLNRVQIAAPDGFDVHVFARINAIINTTVSILLLLGLFSAKAGRWEQHRKVMFSALLLSVVFLVSYILHHLFVGETSFGGTGVIKLIYYVILFSHILLAAGSLPFILLTAFKGLSAQYPEHKKMARKVWPVWFYVSVTGVVVYLLISPYY